GFDWGGPVHTASSRNDIMFAGEHYVGTEDAGNALTTSKEREFPPEDVALMLKDAYGYTITRPSTIRNFYSVLDGNSGSATFGRLLIRGGQMPAPSNDKIIVSQSGSFLTVSVDIGNDVPG